MFSSFKADAKVIAHRDFTGFPCEIEIHTVSGEVVKCTVFNCRQYAAMAQALVQKYKLNIFNGGLTVLLNRL